MNRNIKVIGIISSSRYNGNTATLVREALKGAGTSGADIEEIFLPKYRLEFCTGCFKCMSDGKCPIKDDFEALKKTIGSADGIILGSPTYAASINAIMKNLFERLGMYEKSTSSLLGGKYIAGISTASSSGAAKKVAGQLTGAATSGVFERGYCSGCLWSGYPNHVKAQDDEKTLVKARELGGKLVSDISTKKSYPVQNLFSRILCRFMVKPVFQKYIINNRDGDTKAVYSNLVQRGLLPDNR